MYKDDLSFIKNLVWTTFAKLKGSTTDNLPVTMENVLFHREVILQKGSPVSFSINILDGSGEFEVCENGSIVVSGRIGILPEPKMSWFHLPISNKSGEFTLNTADVYKEFRLRGYDFTGLFCGILTYNNNGKIHRKDGCDFEPLLFHLSSTHRARHEVRNFTWTSKPNRHRCHLLLNSTSSGKKGQKNT